MNSISLCMIVKNEEEKLARCLDSVVGAVKELIVVDTGSTDHTVAIAESYGARVVHYEWSGDFSSARNAGIDVATGEYILVLDADEYVDRKEALEEDLSRSAECYMLPFRNVMDEGVYGHVAIRLFRNKPEHRFKERLHEYIEMDSSSTVMGNTLIYHDGYMNETVEKKDKRNRNLTILKELVEGAPSGYNLYNLAREYQLAEDYEHALTYFELAYNKSKSSFHLPQLLYSYCISLMRSGQLDEGIRMTQAAISAYPKYTDLYFVLGTLYEEKGYYKDAEACWKKCIKVGEIIDSDFYQYGVTIEGVGTVLPQLKLASNSIQKNKYLDAFDFLLPVIQSQKKKNESLNVYLTLASAAKIPLQDQLEFVTSMFPAKEASDVLEVASCLHQSRSALLLTYANMFGLKMSKDIEAAAFLFSHNYESAKEIYAQLEQASESEVISLSILLRDTDLLQMHREKWNLSKQDWKTLQGLLYKGRSERKLTSEVERLLLSAGELLLHLGETQAWFELLAHLENGSAECLFHAYKMTLQAGEVDKVYTQLTQLKLSLQENERFIPLLSKVLLDKGQIETLVSIWENKVKQNGKLGYSTYTAFLDAFQMLGREDLIQKVRESFEERYPLSSYLKC